MAAEQYEEYEKIALGVIEAVEDPEGVSQHMANLQNLKPFTSEQSHEKAVEKECKILKV